jgi:hypothetical protein
MHAPDGKKEATSSPECRLNLKFGGTCATVCTRLGKEFVLVAETPQRTCLQPKFRSLPSPSCSRAFVFSLVFHYLQRTPAPRRFLVSAFRSSPSTTASLCCKLRGYSVLLITRQRTDSRGAPLFSHYTLPIKLVRSSRTRSVSVYFHQRFRNPRTGSSLSCLSLEMTRLFAL